MTFPDGDSSAGDRRLCRHLRVILLAQMYVIVLLVVSYTVYYMTRRNYPFLLEALVREGYSKVWLVCETGPVRHGTSEFCWVIWICF